MSHRARKRFGQHFLHDEHVIRLIVAAISPRMHEHILEIGPGQGAITRPLLHASGSLDVVELDRDVIPLLERHCAGAGELRVHCADALKFDVKEVTKNKLRIVGNLPYNISTPLLFHLFESIPHIADMHFLLQKEVVDRLTANPGSKTWGRLGVMTRLHCEAIRLFNVDSNAFRPRPRVESAFVRLLPHASPPVIVDDERRFARIVNQAFMQRRKTVRNALKGLLDKEDIEAAGVDAGLRPEVLTLQQFAALAGVAEHTN